MNLNNLIESAFIWWYRKERKVEFLNVIKNWINFKNICSTTSAISIALKMWKTVFLNIQVQSTYNEGVYNTLKQPSNHHRPDHWLGCSILQFFFQLLVMFVCLFNVLARKFVSFKIFLLFWWIKAECISKSLGFLEETYGWLGWMNYTKDIIWSVGCLEVNKKTIKIFPLGFF